MSKINTITIKFTVLLILWFCISAYFAKAEDLNLGIKSASELYDERGLTINSSSSSDGKLHVSTVNGNLMYAYPLASFDYNSIPHNVTLMYNGSVAYTSFAHFLQGPDYWNRFSQNRGAWIIGVNGFAVQVLHGARTYLCNPAVNEIDKSTGYTVDDRYLNWVIKGYDFCNRMFPLIDGNPHVSENRDKYDIISLLKADGSLLELKNANTGATINYEGVSSDYHEKFITGTYYESGINSKGMAIVELADTISFRTPVVYFSNNSSWFVPRRVRYFPGDGYEYIFLEDLYAYGKEPLTEPVANSELRKSPTCWPATTTYGHTGAGPECVPSIFYLVGIVNRHGDISSLGYSQNHNKLQPEESDCDYRRNLLGNPKSLGRALFNEVGEYKLEFTNSDILFEHNAGRTVRLVLSDSIRSVSGMERATFSNSVHGYPPLISGISSHDYKVTNSIYTTYCYYSWNDYIVRIEEGWKSRVTKFTNFEYDVYWKKYESSPHDTKFPVANDSSSGYSNSYLTMRNSRIKSVRDGVSKNIVTYLDEYMDGYDSPLDTSEGSNILEISIADVLGGGYYEFLTNTVERTETYSLDDNLILTDRYVFDFATGSIKNLPNYCSHRHIDKITGNESLTNYYYNIIEYSPAVKNEALPYLPYGISYHSYLSKQVISADSVVEVREYEQVKIDTSINIILPVKSSSYFVTALGDTVDKSYETYSYEIDTVRTYDINGRNDSTIVHGDDLQHIIGQEPIKITTTTWNPETKENDPPIINQVQEYLNLSLIKLEDQPSFGIIQNNQQNGYSSSKKKNNNKLQFIDCDETKIITPIYNLLTKEFFLGQDSIVLGGAAQCYEINDVKADSTSKTYCRGQVISDSIISRAGNVFIKDEYTYQDIGDHSARGSMTESTGLSGTSSQYYFLNENTNPGVSDYFPGIDTLKWFYENYSDAPRVIGKKLTLLDNIVYDQLRIELQRPDYSRKPLLNCSFVKKPDNSIRSISQAFQYDRMDMLDKSVNPNGWMSWLTFDPLRNYNLSTVTTPYDFADDSLMTPSYEICDYKYVTGTAYTKIVHEYSGDLALCVKITGGMDRLFYRRGIFDDSEISYDSTSLFAENNFPVYSLLTECDSCDCIKDLTDSLIDCSCITCFDQIVDNIGGLDYMTYEDYDEVYGILNTDYDSLFCYTKIGTGRDYANTYFKFDISDVDSIAAVDSLIIRFNIIGMSPNFGWLKCDIWPLETINLVMTDSIAGNGIDSSGFCQIVLQADQIESIMAYPEAITLKLSLGSQGSVYFSNLDDPPRMHAYGTFVDIEIPPTYNTYTVKYETEYDILIGGLRHPDEKSNYHVNKTLKIDDFRHTFNNYSTPYSRFVKHSNDIGANYKTNNSYRSFGDLNYTYEYNGNGQQIKVTDPDTNITYTSYDALGRPVEAVLPSYECGNGALLSQDTSRSEYEYGTPTSFGVTDQDFFGFCRKQTSINSAGIKKESYFDAFDRLRKEVTDPDSIQKTIKYEYDIQGRLTHVVNIIDAITDQNIRYWYDDFGRMKYKYQPDMGLSSYAYDLAGNVRFSQTSKQIEEDKVVFRQYDDMHRVTVIGEALLTPLPMPIVFDPATDLDTNDLVLNNLTETLDPYSLNITDNGNPYSELTVNYSLVWQPIDNPAPHIESEDYLNYDECLPYQYTCLNDLIGTDYTPPLPLLVHASVPQDYHSQPELPSNPDDFENASTHPNNIRTVFWYDALPDTVGSVWKEFPTKALWDSMAAPRYYTGSALHRVRNLIGKTSAVAYREEGGKPYNYMVFSYDERGRVEALLRYTINLGFDAVYYTYNSMDLVTSVRVADPLRNYTTWYTYDNSGRIQEVFTAEPASVGLYGTSGDWHPTAPKYIAPQPFPAEPDMTYSFDHKDMLTNLYYKAIDLNSDYFYNSRGWLDSMYVGDLRGLVFKQDISYHQNGLGLISGQVREHRDKFASPVSYAYDRLNQLTDWTDAGNQSHELIEYDIMGNRKHVATWDTIAQETFFNYDNAARPNQLTKMKRDFPNPQLDPFSEYEYFADGAMSMRKQIKNNNDEYQYSKEKFTYDWRGLLSTYERRSAGFNQQLPVDCWQDYQDALPPVEWAYMYNPFGEREQKRLTNNKDKNNLGCGILPWTYYLLGADNRQFAVYQGFETKEIKLPCSPDGYETADVILQDAVSRLVFFPTEYNTYGAGSSLDIAYKTDETGTWRKHFNIHDHLGNVRAIIRLRDTSEILAQYDYAPFGEVLWSSGADNRLSFIGKEKDNESSLGDFGVRKYDDGIGRFNSIDPLWEVQYAWSPYHYCINNPMVGTDGSGLLVRNIQGEVAFFITEDGFQEYDRGIKTSVTFGWLMTQKESYIFAAKNTSNVKKANTNCHGRTFADGKYWINSNQVQTILDDEYSDPLPLENSKIKVGDVIIYRNGKVIVHSATVVKTGKNGIKVNTIGGGQHTSYNTSIDAAYPAEKMGETDKTVYTKSSIDLIGTDESLKAIQEEVTASQKKKKK